MTKPVLYSFRRCPYAIRARMALAISEAEIEVRDILLRNKPPQMLEASPKGTVPVVVLADGKVIDESLDVMRWTLERSDPEGWLGKVDDALLETNDGPFKHHLDRYKYATRHGTDPDEHRAECLAILQSMESRLAGSEWLAGDTRGFTDTAIMPFIRQFANADREWFDAQPLPKIQAWLARQLNSELFKHVMIKRELWTWDDSSAA